jgi:hypothetical protein
MLGEPADDVLAGAGCSHGQHRGDQIRPGETL